MADWGGAQWLILFLLALRVFTGAAKANGTLVIGESPSSPWVHYVVKRCVDATFLAILIWGDFF